MLYCRLKDLIPNIYSGSNFIIKTNTKKFRLKKLVTLQILSLNQKIKN